ncbi:MAG: hypothetical protein ACI9E9_001131 [Reinekea sp.]|jgi:hypothetical protein
MTSPHGRVHGAPSFTVPQRQKTTGQTNAPPPNSRGALRFKHQDIP